MTLGICGRGRKAWIGAETALVIFVTSIMTFIIFLDATAPAIMYMLSQHSPLSDFFFFRKGQF